MEDRISSEASVAQNPNLAHPNCGMTVCNIQSRKQCVCFAVFREIEILAVC